MWRAILIVFGGRVLLSFAQFNGALFRTHTNYEAAMGAGRAAVLLAMMLAVLHYRRGVSGLAVAWFLYGLAEFEISFYLLFARILSREASSPPIRLPLLREMSKQAFIFGLCSAVCFCAEGIASTRPLGKP